VVSESRCGLDWQPSGIEPSHLARVSFLEINLNSRSKLVFFFLALTLLSACSGMEGYLKRAAECDKEVAKLISPKYETSVARVDTTCNKNGSAINCLSSPIYSSTDLNESKRAELHRNCINRKIKEEAK
jgi:hypothetical protein